MTHLAYQADFKLGQAARQVGSLNVHADEARPGGVDSYFDAYFLNGTLPKTDTVHVSQLGDPVPPAASAKGQAKPSHALQ